MTRTSGFAPIESCGVIGDGKSGALVAENGSIDWWAVPALDSPPLFAALLEPVRDTRPPEGGHFALEPTGSYRTERRYIPGTNVLETTFVTRGGTVRVTDSVNQGVDGTPPWGELVREVHPVRGRVPMRIDTRCWSPSRRSYVAYPGSEELDASLLLLARTGFCSGRDPRFRSTIDAISGELRKGPLVYRLSGASSFEGAFVPASFWLVDALVRAGRTRQARDPWREARTLVNDLGLLSEEIDPSTGEFLGNVPQGLSHLALVNADVRSVRLAAGGCSGVAEVMDDLAE